MRGFTPDFDDCRWSDTWSFLPLIQPVPGNYGGLTVTNWCVEEAVIAGIPYHLAEPLEVRGLVLPDGKLWMSDVPQERLMMFNNAIESFGRILVGGLALGIYPQYAMIRAPEMAAVESITIIERNADVIDLIGPIVQVAAAAQDIPLSIIRGDVEAWMRDNPDERFDTIFLDTWEKLDAANLPLINRLRDLASLRLAAEGKVLLWGYNWMLRLHEAACYSLLAVKPEERGAWLEKATEKRQDVKAMLLPVLEQFDGKVIDDWDAALNWCREHVIHLK